MRTTSILSAAAVALALIAPMTAYASRGQVDSGTAPTGYYEVDPAALALEQQDYQATVARQHVASQPKAEVSQDSHLSQPATK
jgi:hypothetical protein